MVAKPLIPLDVALLHACQNSTVIAASERIRRALQHAYDAYHVGLGLRAWRSARVLTLGAYLRQRHDELLQIAGSQRILLGTNAQRLAWLDHAPESTDIDFDAVYDDIASAWQIIHDWDLVAGLDQFVDNDNHRLFRDWTSRYRRAADRRRWLTEAELPGLIAAELRSGRLPAAPAAFIGFDIVPPAVGRLIDAIRDAGATVTVHELQGTYYNEPSSVTCDDPEQELDHAILWARELLLAADEPLAVGIAIPDVIARYDRIVRQLDCGLRPANRNPDPALCPYNISGGISLAAAPVVAAALQLLRWLIEPVHHSEVESLLRSPFLELEAIASQSQNASLPESYDAKEFVHRFGTAPLYAVVGAAKIQNASPLAETIRQMRSALELAGWPNATILTSESFQAYRNFLDLLDELTAASGIVRSVGFAETLATIQSAARRGLFAPMRPEAPLQVLGYLETAHLQFTHLWVVGLSDLSWPGPARPNVYIPLRLLRSAGVPRIDADSEVAFARRLTNHWRRAARAVVFCNPQTVDESSCRTSRLVDASPNRRAAEPYPHSHPFLVRSPHVALESRDESETGGVVLATLRHHGSQILRDQSACPFRAFARYRLHATQRTRPHSFFDQADRGVATHLSLRDTYTQMDRRGAADEAQTAAIVSAAVASALSHYKHFPRLFLDSEHKRLTALVTEWLRYEQGRVPSSLIASERPTSLTLGPLEFRLQIDRIDELDEGALVVDYKTGISNPLAVFGERPEEPQLAMYALSVPNVHAIAYARVKRDDYRIVGWSDPSRAGHAATERYLRAPPPGQTWEAVIDSWRTNLTNLSKEFIAGVADVSPRNAAACRQCDLHAVCRIRETGPTSANDLDN